jgi:hypothetical protein
MSNDFTPTYKARYTTNAGSVVELVIPLDAEDIDALIEQALHIDTRALENGLLVANPMVKGAVSQAQSAGIKTKRDGNPVFQCVSMDILPQADGRTKVALFGNTYKQPRDDYATVTMLFKPEELAEKFKEYYQFKVDTFRMAGKFNVDFFVEWYESTKVNNAGRPYKNFAGIHVKDGAQAPEKIEEQEVATPQPDDVPF